MNNIVTIFLELVLVPAIAPLIINMLINLFVQRTNSKSGHA